MERLYAKSKKGKYSSKYLTDEMNLRLGSVSCVSKEYEFGIEHGLLWHRLRTQFNLIPAIAIILVLSNDNVYVTCTDFLSRTIYILASTNRRNVLINVHSFRRRPHGKIRWPSLSVSQVLSHSMTETEYFRMESLTRRIIRWIRNISIINMPNILWNIHKDKRNR